MARHNRIDPESTGPSPKFFLRIPARLKEQIEQAAAEERRQPPEYMRLLLEDAMRERAARRGDPMEPVPAHLEGQLAHLEAQLAHLGASDPDLRRRRRRA